MGLAALGEPVSVGAMLPRDRYDRWAARGCHPDAQGGLCECEGGAGSNQEKETGLCPRTFR